MISSFGIKLLLINELLYPLLPIKIGTGCSPLGNGLNEERQQIVHGKKCSKAFALYGRMEFGLKE